jgi:hypothetical protein
VSCGEGTKDSTWGTGLASWRRLQVEQLGSLEIHGEERGHLKKGQRWGNLGNMDLMGLELSRGWSRG